MNCRGDIIDSRKDAPIFVLEKNDQKKKGALQSVLVLFSGLYKMWILFNKLLQMKGINI